MSVTPAQLEACLKESLKPIHVNIEDISGGCGTSFKLLIVSEVFESLKLLERQRRVYDALDKLMPQIHALEMRCLPPSRWKKSE